MALVGVSETVPHSSNLPSIQSSQTYQTCPTLSSHLSTCPPVHLSTSSPFPFDMTSTQNNGPVPMSPANLHGSNVEPSTTVNAPAVIYLDKLAPWDQMRYAVFNMFNSILLNCTRFRDGQKLTIEEYAEEEMRMAEELTGWSREKALRVSVVVHGKPYSPTDAKAKTGRAKKTTPSSTGVVGPTSGTSTSTATVVPSKPTSKPQCHAQTKQGAKCSKNASALSYNTLHCSTHLVEWDKKVREAEAAAQPEETETETETEGDGEEEDGEIIEKDDENEVMSDESEETSKEEVVVVKTQPDLPVPVKVETENSTTKVEELAPGVAAVKKTRTRKVNKAEA